MSMLFYTLLVLLWLSIPAVMFVLLLVLAILALSKKPVKKFIIGILIYIGATVSLSVMLVVLAVATDPTIWCNHEYEITEEIRPTCSEEGEIHKHCPLCNNEDVEYIDKLDHLWEVTEKITPSCVEQGKVIRKCALCGDENVEILNKTDHSWKTISTVEATCTEQGKVVKKCTVCELEDIKYDATKEHSWIVDTTVKATCTTDGYTVGKCKVCSSTQKNIINALGHSMTKVTRVEPTYDKEGKIVRRCDRCQHEEYQVIEKLNHTGKENDPYVLNADEWYVKHCAGTSTVRYIDKWVKVSGTVLSISDNGDLKGYYLAGGKGQGLVCWVYSDKLDAHYGQQIEYIGKVVVEDSNHIEISEGRVVNAAYPTEKLKSPVTISNWSASRDSVGGVEWNFKFTNNTEKTIKYIWIEWDCYNAVGDLVYDEITGKSSHGIKYTGPLDGGQTSNLMCNPTLFYSYSYKSAKIKRLEVEFMDGTFMKITDQGYTDIIATD